MRTSAGRSGPINPRFTPADVTELIGYLALTFGFSLEFHGRAALLDEL